MDKSTSRTDTLHRERLSVRKLLHRLREHRLRRNWTQAEMARRAGISRPAYQNFEGGYSNITLTNLMRILSVLGFSARITDLVPEVEEERTVESAAQAPRQRARKKRHA